MPRGKTTNIGSDAKPLLGDDDDGGGGGGAVGVLPEGREEEEEEDGIDWHKHLFANDKMLSPLSRCCWVGAARKDWGLMGRLLWAEES